MFRVDLDVDYSMIGWPERVTLILGEFFVLYCLVRVPTVYYFLGRPSLDISLSHFFSH